jgi:hypothetical protein
MRYNANFHPEWGYLAPSPNFVRTARIVFIAVAVGGMAGAGVVLSLVERPVGDTSVAARTLVRPVEAASVPAGTPRAAQVNTQAAIQNQPAKPAPTNGSSASESGTGPSTQPATSIAAPAEVPAAGAASPAKLPADEAAAAVKAPVQKKATKKPHPASRYASRGEQTNGVRGLRRLFDYQSPFGANVPAEYYPRRGYGGYREQRWGGYYPDGGFSYR